MSSNLALIDNSNNLEINNTVKIDPKEIGAIFNILNAKPDSIIKTFPRAVNISTGDIHNLRTMIDDKLSQYKLNGRIEQMSVRYSNNVFKDFKDWAQFIQEIQINSKSIENINLVWDFMINANGYTLPQRHTIVVRLSSFISKSQMVQMLVSGSIENLDEIDKNIVPVMCKVDCVNSSIGDEIVQIVGRWNDGLEICTAKEDKIRKLRKNRLHIANLIRYSFSFSSIFIVSVFISTYLKNININLITDLSVDNLKLIIMSIPFIYIFIELLKRIGFNLGEKFLKCIMAYGDYHPFKISKGDLNKQKVIEESNNKNKKTIISLMLTILGNVAISVISNIISNLIG